MKPLLIFLISVLLVFSIDLKPIALEDLQTDTISVTVSGEVENPGTFELDPYSTVNDLYEVLELKEDADVSNINGNTILKDKDVLNIRKITEAPVISINTSSKEELMTLPGIGESTAQAIITYRETHGFYQNLEDLMNVKGIGERKFSTIKERITL